jgi:hypothetical protein
MELFRSEFRWSSWKDNYCFHAKAQSSRKGARKTAKDVLFLCAFARTLRLCVKTIALREIIVRIQLFRVFCDLKTKAGVCAVIY